MKYYILYANIAFFSFQISHSNQNEFSSWVRSTLLPGKIERIFIEQERSGNKTSEEIASLKEDYLNRKEGYFSFVKNDKLTLRSNSSVVCHNLASDSLTADRDENTLHVAAALILKHSWISSKGRSRISYHFLRQGNFDSCPTPNAYAKLIAFVNDDTKKEKIFSDKEKVLSNLKT